MDIPEGMMLIADHEQAMVAARVDYEAAANLRQAEIDALNQQLASWTDLTAANADLQQNLTNATAALTAMTTERDKWAKDNADLRNAQAMYLTNTTAAQEAFKQLQIGMTSAAILNAAGQLKALGVDVAGIEAAVGGTI